jgi:Tol biopolymer transport system component
MRLLALGGAAAAALTVIAVAGAAAEEPLPVRLDVGACGRACPGDRSPVWSPDGKRIAFVRYVGTRPNRHQAIFTIEPHGAGAKLVFDPGGGTGPQPPFEGLAWSPDGTALTAAAANRVWLFHLDGRPPRALSDRAFAVAAATPRWSPDGRLVAYTTSHAPSFRGPIFCCELRVANVHTGATTRLAGSYGGSWAHQPEWAPDGRLAYVTGPRATMPCPPPACERYDLGEIRLMNADGTGDRLLVPADGQGPRTLLGWAPSGDRLLFAAGGPSAPGQLASVRADGTDLRILRDRGATLSCCWLAPDASRAVAVNDAPAGVELRMLVFGAGPPQDYALLAAGPGRQTRLRTPVSWSPDGRAFAFLADGECATLMGVYVWENGRARRVTNPCRRIGTPRGDRLRGTARVEALYGRAGADLVEAGAGADYLDGGSGDDRLRGGNGDDRLSGGPGRDLLSGDSGWDRIYARDGARDVIRCGSGRDGVRADRLDVVAADCEVLERA